MCWERRPNPEVELLRGTDAFDANISGRTTKPSSSARLCRSLKELKRRGLPFLVLEKDPGTLKAEEMPSYRPADTARDVVPEADVLLVTGTTLLNDTLEDLLSWARPDRG